VTQPIPGSLRPRFDHGVREGVGIVRAFGTWAIGAISDGARRGERRLAVLALLAWLIASGCGGPDDGPTLFRALHPDETGITFANTVTPDHEHDFQRDVYFYNGGGVAAGDVDGDGRVDLYFAGNRVTSRLYLNRGGLRFQDVTEIAGVGTSVWATGVSMVDIDGDRDLDIHVSVSGPEWSTAEERRNLLFVNDGAGHFTEEAASRGIADPGHTSHGVFLDQDRDGDLDLFLLGNSPGEFGRGASGATGFGGATAGDPAGHDRFYRNVGDGRFVDASEAAGLHARLGYGLGGVSADVDVDGWPDLYVSNDASPNDALYMNNGDGTFSDRVAEWLDYTSFAGMGADIADLDDDGWPDIVQVDMMPADLTDRKRVSGATASSELIRLERTGHSPQYSLNTLQLSQGTMEDGRVVFSDIGRMAGVAYTAWSWSPLVADYDNDGRKDLFITNGYPRAVIDYDYQVDIYSAGRMRDPEAAERLLAELLDELRPYDHPNYAFWNNGDLTFVDRTRDWGLGLTGFSYGAAYADLDDDGRLDLVVSNVDATASVYRNEGPEGDASHYLRLRLEGDGANTRGVGSRLRLVAGGKAQYIDHTPYRGYLSTMDDRVHFGLGAADRVDSLTVVWPDGRTQTLTELAVDRTLTLRQADAEAGTAGRPDRAAGRRRPIRMAGAGRGPTYEHRPDEHGTDFATQPLLPHQVSQLGPPLAVADVDGDGADDVFIGGAAGQSGRLLLQRPGGRFVASGDSVPWVEDAAYDDWGAAFLDADGDGLHDLYVASGGYRLPSTSRRLQDRLYMNRGGGRFVRSTTALPEMLTSTATVRPADMDGDGDMDLFVGGRLIPGSYPRPPRSYLLRNEGGRFVDATGDLAPELVDPGGMVTDAVWLDFDEDGRPDLVMAGTWTSIRFFSNDGTRLVDVTADTGLPPLRGWWYSLEPGDFDGDGRVDLVAGNVGLNHSYTTSPSSPFGVYAADFSENLRLDLVFTREIDGTEYPYYGLAVLARQIIALGVRYPTHESFAGVSVVEAFGASALRDAIHYQADTFASVLLRNRGGGRFTAEELPSLAQIAPIRDALAHDVDGDGNLDLIAAGNLFGTEPNTPPLAAGKGVWLRGDGRGGFTAVRAGDSGLLAPLDARALALVDTPDGPMLLVGNYGGPLQVFELE
jgi:hypothetical protein